MRIIVEKEKLLRLAASKIYSGNCKAVFSPSPYMSFKISCAMEEAKPKTLGA